jgi:hypothetical protein
MSKLKLTEFQIEAMGDILGDYIENNFHEVVERVLEYDMPEEFEDVSDYIEAIDQDEFDKVIQYLKSTL